MVTSRTLLSGAQRALVDLVGLKRAKWRFGEILQIKDLPILQTQVPARAQPGWARFVSGLQTLSAALLYFAPIFRVKPVGFAGERLWDEQLTLLEALVLTEQFKIHRMVEANANYRRGERLDRGQCLL